MGPQTRRIVIPQRAVVLQGAVLLQERRKARTPQTHTGDDACHPPLCVSMDCELLHSGNNAGYAPSGAPTKKAADSRPPP